MRLHVSNIDRGFLDWLVLKLEDDREIPKTIIEAIRKIAKYDDRELQEFQERWAKPGRGLTVAKFQLPFLDSNLGQVSLLSGKEQAKVLGIKLQAEFLTEDFRMVEKWHFYDV